ncbi:MULTISPECIES: lysophospholipid acyltransferase family protein [unclassified Streptomyces]|uniref:lysophospholipid acyltransferase family protein n=1 Tax=unclassified Streptomyces TaxID=2593676 RepID=UPI000F71AD74|nr:MULTISPECIES: lysophospholipid acyltransferase family protein [unclassified Streptomyces]AZM64044.1 1-acyl-sn-glycerol-3-phosphate acyltransferase [Streptomyces sp. WAC 01438]RSM88134.1 1-acyl-sn-glycerol-3-phosphate acyltransferase [Streptomyces sp. WAC 01420]
MLSRAAAVLLPVFGRLTVTLEADEPFAAGSVFVANHDSVADPAVVLAALRAVGVAPAVMATAGLWRVPVLGRALAAGGHIPVRRGTARAADALEAAAEAVRSGRHVLIYAEGGLPAHRDAAPAPPRPFRTGPARLSAATGAPVVPVGQAGARRLASGPVPKQLAGVLTGPVRRPRFHVHVGRPVHLPSGTAAGTTAAHRAVGAAWRRAALAVG